MARGHQKIQSQAKAAEKAAKIKKAAGHSANEQKKAAQKALVHACVICKVRFYCLLIINILITYLFAYLLILFLGTNARSKNLQATF